MSRVAGRTGTPTKSHVIRVIRPGLWGAATDRQLAFALLLVVSVYAVAWVLCSLWAVTS